MSFMSAGKCDLFLFVVFLFSFVAAERNTNTRTHRMLPGNSLR